MNTMRFLAVFAIVGFFGFINAKEWRETPSVEKRLETQINIAQKGRACGSDTCEFGRDEV